MAIALNDSPSSRLARIVAQVSAISWARVPPVRCRLAMNVSVNSAIRDANKFCLGETGQFEMLINFVLGKRVKCHLGANLF